MSRNSPVTFNGRHSPMSRPSIAFASDRRSPVSRTPFSDLEDVHPPMSKPQVPDLAGSLSPMSPAFFVTHVSGPYLGGVRGRVPAREDSRRRELRPGSPFKLHHRPAGRSSPSPPGPDPGNPRKFRPGWRVGARGHQPFPRFRESSPPSAWKDRRLDSRGNRRGNDYG
jgi:hypothetical protein